MLLLLIIIPLYYHLCPFIYSNIPKITKSVNFYPLHLFSKEESVTPSIFNHKKKSILNNTFLSKNRAKMNFVVTLAGVYGEYTTNGIWRAQINNCVH